MVIVVIIGVSWGFGASSCLGSIIVMIQQYISDSWLGCSCIVGS